MIPYILIIISLISLYFGAEWLVGGSSRLALRLGVNPLLVAMTIVAYGTSMPELMISVQATIAGAGNIAIGNVVGSNIFNIAAALGIAALICPLPIARRLYRFEIPAVLLASLLLGFFLLRDNTLRIWEGLIFLALFAGIVAHSLINAKHKRAVAEIDANICADNSGKTGIGKNANRDTLPKKDTILKCAALIVVGLVTVIVGADILVRGAVELAYNWGVSETLIALTIVAGGTSLPELVITAVAAYKKQNDIAIGNIIGSCIFNILCILGIVGVMSPIPVNEITALDIVLIVVLAAALFVPLLTKCTLTRWQGGMFLGIYAAYIIILCINA